MNKKIVGAFIAAALVLSIGVGMSFAAPNLGNSLGHRQDGTTEPFVPPIMKGNPHQFKQLMLMYAIDDPDEAVDPIIWTHVPGNEVSGFKLCLDPTVEYYYLGIMKLKPYSALVEGMYPFFINGHPETSITTSGEEMSYLQYWTDRGADEDAPEGTLGWLLYHIFLDDTPETRLPIFFLQVNEEGEYKLIDGFQYIAGSGVQTLRVDSMPTIYNADHGYLLGTYKYIAGPWAQGETTFPDLHVELTMTFRTCECDDCLGD